MIDRLDIIVEEIGCTGCVSDMETILLNTDGILSVVIAYSENRISIEYDTEVVTRQRIVSVIRKMGLKPRNTD